VLPNPNDSPTFAAQHRVYFAITIYVSGNLGEPKFAPGFGHPAVPTATVPKAPVHEHGNSLPVKNEIWFAENELFTPPASNAVCFEG